MIRRTFFEDFIKPSFLPNGVNRQINFALARPISAISGVDEFKIFGLEIACRFSDLRQRQFGGAVCAEQAVCFLESIGELGITKTAEHRGFAHHFQQLAVNSQEFFIAFSIGIAPDLWHARFGTFGIGDTAKLGEDNRLAAVRVTVQGQDPATRTAPVE